MAKNKKDTIRLKDAVQNQPSSYELGEELTDLTRERLQQRTKNKPRKHTDR